jgi:hypothetical protein
MRGYNALAHVKQSAFRRLTVCVCVRVRMIVCDQTFLKPKRRDYAGHMKRY